MSAESVVTLARSVQVLVVLPMFCGVFGPPDYKLTAALAIIVCGCYSTGHERIMRRPKP